MPEDYSDEALFDEETRGLMDIIEFKHGGAEYDSRYPDGIPTSIILTLNDGTQLDSGMVMYPSGHARNTTADLAGILDVKFERMGDLALEGASQIIARINDLPKMGTTSLRSIWDFDIKQVGGFS